MLESKEVFKISEESCHDRRRRVPGTVAEAAELADELVKQVR